MDQRMKRLLGRSLASLGGSASLPNTPLLSDELYPGIYRVSKPGLNVSNSNKLVGTPRFRLFIPHSSNKPTKMTIANILFSREGFKRVHRHSFHIPDMPKFNIKCSSVDTYVTTVIHSSYQVNKAVPFGLQSSRNLTRLSRIRRHKELAKNNIIRSITCNTRVTFFNRQSGFSMGLTVRTMRPGLRVRRRFGYRPAVLEALPAITSGCAAGDLPGRAGARSGGLGFLNFPMLILIITSALAGLSGRARAFLF